jgi:hypothetical protein
VPIAVIRQSNSGVGGRGFLAELAVIFVYLTDPRSGGGGGTMPEIFRRLTTILRNTDVAADKHIEFRVWSTP